jgi:hypothetical protein
MSPSTSEVDCRVTVLAQIAPETLPLTVTCWPATNLGTATVALAAASIADTASALNPLFGGGAAYFDGGGFLYRAPQPNQSPPDATSRPSNRDMRRAPPMGGRGMRGGSDMGGGRTNGGMGGRR